MKRRVLIPMLLGATVLAGAAEAQTWRPESPAVTAERERLAREQWRAGFEERQALGRADQRRTEATLYGLQAQRAPAVVPPPGLRADPSPLPDLALQEDQEAEAARRRALDSGQALAGLEAWIDRARRDP